MSMEVIHTTTDFIMRLLFGASTHPIVMEELNHCLCHSVKRADKTDQGLEHVLVGKVRVGRGEGKERHVPIGQDFPNVKSG